ncbi:hypothetical protein TNIN_458371 [Trichonephila inaurata madagascariensis]|uniref:Uncharacterized protein n=1 Tax=Trichonephila inaurata madagascariensis TaxID=2747483 RepID=A0A8X6WQL0_9ARAC|nr:hypothetical protein TNIN_458371 [Trichonephila inaurata madagascariensis]
MIAQCVEQLGGILACINDDGSDFLLTRDKSEMHSSSVGEVTVALAESRALAATIRSGSLRIFVSRLLLIGKKIPPPSLQFSWAVGWGVLSCQAVRLDDALFSYGAWG